MHYFGLDFGLIETYGDEVLFQRIKDYKDKWHAEITVYVKVKEDVEHLQFDVRDMKMILTDIEKGIAVIQILVCIYYVCI